MNILLYTLSTIVCIAAICYFGASLRILLKIHASNRKNIEHTVLVGINSSPSLSRIPKYEGRTAYIWHGALQHTKTADSTTIDTNLIAETIAQTSILQSIRDKPVAGVQPHFILDPTQASRSTFPRKVEILLSTQQGIPLELLQRLRSHFLKASVNQSHYVTKSVAESYPNYPVSKKFLH